MTEKISTKLVVARHNRRMIKNKSPSLIIHIESFNVFLLIQSKKKLLIHSLSSHNEIYIFSVLHRYLVGNCT